MLVYLAGPVDGVQRQEALDWREDVSQRLNQAGVSTFSPAHAFSVVYFSSNNPSNKAATARAVTEINRYTISQSSVVLAYLPKDRITIGTIREIEYAVSIGKPVVVLVERTDISFLSLYDTIQVSDWDEAVGAVIEVLLTGPFRTSTI
jgi:nucleoside 2-deoxyribosyltransferase